MTKFSFKASWTNIDMMEDPRYFIHFMDVLNNSQSQKAVDTTTHTLAVSLLKVKKGDYLLDVGCGTGEITQALGQLVGELGQVVGVDNSRNMVGEALARFKGIDLPIKYIYGDAKNLPFNDNTFDGCYCKGLFEVVDNPLQVLKELFRVVSPAGRVLVSAPDGGITIDALDRNLTRKIMNFVCDNEIQGWIGRQLVGLFKECGFTEITVVPVTFSMTDFIRVKQLWLQTYVDAAQSAGVITVSEGEQWLENLKRKFQEGRFFSAITIYNVAGRKPE